MTSNDSDLPSSELSDVARFAEAYVEALRAGNHRTLAEWANEFPSLKGELERIARTLDAIETRKPGVEAAVAPKSINEYRIVREVGRGGMGVVHEAIEESLGRRVAIKLLPLFGILGERVVERFQREAQAAGRLVHQNIVPVYSAGRHEGMPYYVMQLIDGPSLEAVLSAMRKREPSSTDSTETEIPQASLSTVESLSSQSQSVRFRAAARIALQAAEALAYAHSQGVLHRDVKPANLLLDPTGKVWLTDFGLAQMDGGASLTGTGDVAGTLRYLAPERLLGTCGPTSDVYSLGLVLYEMLTTKPAFPQRDRAELIRAVEGWDPPRPSSMVANLPPDLETIVLKSIVKDPAKRYSTANAMAADLRNFLENKPIVARRPNWRYHLSKWCRRNPSLAASIVLAFVFLLAGTITSTLLWLHADKKRIEAELAKEDLKEENAKANNRLKLIRELFDGTSERVANLPGNTAVRAVVIDNAITAYVSHYTGSPEDPDACLELIRLYLRKASIEGDRGDSEAANACINKALALLNDPKCPLTKLEKTRQRALAFMFLSDHSMNHKTSGETLAALHHEINELEKIDKHPRYRVNLEASRLYSNAVQARKSGRHEESEQFYLQALAKYEQLCEVDPENASHFERVAATHIELGIRYKNTNRRAEARKSLESALSILAEKQNQLSLRGRSYRADAYTALGMLGPPEIPQEEVLSYYNRAAKIYLDLIHDYPSHAQFLWRFGNVSLGRSDIRLAGVTPGFAEAVIREALAFFPDDDKRRKATSIEREMFARLNGRLGELLIPQGRYEEGRARLQTAIAILRNLTEAAPGSLMLSKTLAFDLHLLAECRTETEYSEKTLETAMEAISMQEKIVETGWGAEAARADLARYQRSAGKHCLVLGKWKEAVEHFQSMAKSDPVSTENSRIASKLIAKHVAVISDPDMRKAVIQAGVEHLGSWIQTSVNPQLSFDRVVSDHSFKPLLESPPGRDLVAEIKKEKTRQSK